VATSEDDVKDALNINFEEDFDLEMPEITVDKTDPAPAAAFEDCALNYSINQAITDLNNADLDDVDIDSIEFKSAAYEYSNGKWPILGGGTVACTISMTQVDRSGDPQDTEFPEFQIDQENGTVTPFVPTTENINVVNYYLAKDNWDEAFDICIVCDETDQVDDFAVSIKLLLEVAIKGEL
jgi:hypothetical protein